MINNVIKRDGSVEPFQIGKLQGWCKYASKFDIRWEPLLEKALEKLHDTCKTQDITLSMIEACVEVGDEAHLRVAARLLRGDIYKGVYGSVTPVSFSESYAKLIKDGYWKDYGLSVLELSRLNEAFDPQMDKELEYASLCQFLDKYGLGEGFGKERRLVETPQLALMGIAIDIFRDDDLDHVINFYNIIKHRMINIATPIMASSRTGENGSASCLVYSHGDTIDSIDAGSSIGYQMTANRAGIGTEFDIRSWNDIVANGKCQHVGKIPHYKGLQANIETVKQGVRGGAATVSFNVLDPEIDDLLRSKHPTTDASKRFPKMDFSLVHNIDFLNRAIDDGDWVLVSLVEAPDLHNAFYYDRKKFPALMDHAIKAGIGKTVKARDIFKMYLRQWQETGRIYSTNVDHMNSHTPFYDTIRISNLCQEIGLPTVAFLSPQDLYDEPDPATGLVGLCFLLAIDVAKTPEDMYEKVAYYACRALDNIIDKMHYPLEALKSGQKFRSIGVGITNLAYYLAKEGYSYDDQESRTFIHELAELHQFSLYRASVELAKERGRFEWYDRCHYQEGKLCLDTYNKNIDKYHDAELLRDWKTLYADMAEHGMRFSTVSAHMPCESSSMYGYSTNGLYPIRQYRVNKSRPEGLAPFPAPGLETIGMNYQLAYDIKSVHMNMVYGIVQKFTCQGISADEYLRIDDYPGKRVPMSELMNNFLFAASIGKKTNYYFNTAGRTSEKGIECEGCDV